MSVGSILYVPGSPFNLLSISRLTHSLNCIVSFTKDSVILQDQSSRQTIGTKCESNGHYSLSYGPTHPMFALSPHPLNIHAQLGHPSLAKLQQMVPSLSKLYSLPCESCQLGKHTYSSFPNRVSSCALSSFLLVHSNIWCLSHTESTLGSRYFVTFIDDFSCCT